MDYFFADDHYGVHPGKVIYENLPGKLKNNIAFFENNWEVLENFPWDKECELLILNMIGETCKQPHPGNNSEQKVRSYLEHGGNVLLLHGSSAAFWRWEWWRKIVGLRWVRPGDPDQTAPSTHPVKPYTVTVSKTRHPLIAELEIMKLPADEIYINLENTSPCMNLLETKIEEGTFVQCCETISPWGGKLISFIPGHTPAVTSSPAVIKNIVKIINYLKC